MFNNSIKKLSDFLKRKNCMCCKKEQTNEEEKKEEKTTGQLNFKIVDDKVVHIHPPCSCAWCKGKCIIFSRCE